MKTLSQYVWDVLSDNPLMETSSGGNATLYTQEPHLYGATVSERDDEESSFYHYDGNGATRCLSDAAGLSKAHLTYDAFGSTVAESGSTTTELRYNGARGYLTSPPTDDIYVRARTYSPGASRWLSRDPVRSEDNGNLYEYSSNRPLVRSDPSGLWTDPIDGPGDIMCSKKYLATSFACFSIDCGYRPPLERYRKKICRCCKKIKYAFTKDPKLNALLECAKRQGCLPRDTPFKCRLNCAPGDEGLYRDPYGGWPRIYLCENKPVDPKTALEEVYHALTLCWGGNPLGSSLDKLDDLIDLNGLGSMRECLSCLGRELLAKKCVLGGGSYGISQANLGEIFASCDSCPDYNPLSDFFTTPSGIMLNIWYTTYAAPDCDSIDKQCGATKPK